MAEQTDSNSLVSISCFNFLYDLYMDQWLNRQKQQLYVQHSILPFPLLSIYGQMAKPTRAATLCSAFRASISSIIYTGTNGWTDRGINSMFSISCFNFLYYLYRDKWQSRQRQQLCSASHASISSMIYTWTNG